MSQFDNHDPCEVLHQAWTTLKANSDLDLSLIKIKLRDDILYVEGEIQSDEMKKDLINTLHNMEIKNQFIIHIKVQGDRGLIGYANDQLKMI